MTTPATAGVHRQVPEPGLTADEMIARAVALRAALVAEQSATEQRTYYGPEMHDAFLKAGFYHLYVPRRYGGYEFDVPTYARVVKEIARGCVSTAWCLGLAMNHALQVASWWPAEAQDAIFAGGDFRSGSVAAPVGTIRRTGDGWQIDGQIAFASGTPHATYYMGQAILAGTEHDEAPTMMMFVAPRDEWTMLDDWGDMLGLKGSGSHSIRFDATQIPAAWALEGHMGDVDVAGGTPGSRLHANPMYSGRGMTIFTLTLAAITVGAAYNALDEYERLMRIKTTATRIRLAEAALHDSALQHMELCRRNIEDAVPFTYGDDITLAGVLREVIVLCWEIVDDDLWQTVGASVARDGERMERIFRDMAVAVAHRNPQLRDYYYGEVGRAALGEPRIS
jgi:3-hydroxy-9,10-secoandrosta-1,3,5(10)-triene-9,17-dione monooxygenase